jgi:hypothetical protein
LALFCVLYESGSSRHVHPEGVGETKMVSLFYKAFNRLLLGIWSVPWNRNVLAMKQDSLGHGTGQDSSSTLNLFLRSFAAPHLCGVIFLAKRLVALQTKIDFSRHTELQISFNKKTT